jgi:hypothetical protein
MPDVEIPDPAEAQEKGADPFTRKIALCVAVYAVILALTSTAGGSAKDEMMMEQMKANTYWALYQGKVIRVMNCDTNLDRYELERLRETNPAALAHIKKCITDNQTEKARHNSERKDAKENAEQAEKKRNARNLQDPYYEHAEILMQVAIVLASVAMLSGRRWAFYTSFILAILGLVLAINGWLLLDGGQLFAERENS